MLNIIRSMKTGLCLLVLLAISACSIFGDKDEPVEVPAKLTDIASPEVTGQAAWSNSVGDGGDDINGFRLSMDELALYAADADGRISAFSLETGKNVWQVKTDLRLISGPFLLGDYLLLGTLDGEVVALHRDNGSRAWRAAATSEVLASPVGEQGVVVARSADGKLVGLSLADGQRLWTFDRNVPTLTLRGVSEPIIHDGLVFAGLDNGKLAALDLRTGALKWEQAISLPSGRSELERIVDLDAQILIVNNIVYAVSYGGNMMALDISNGRPIWRKDLASYTGLTHDGNRIYVTDRKGHVWALDRDNGGELWVNKTIEYRGLSAPVIHGNYVLVADQEGYLHWLSQTDGEIVGRKKLGGQAFTDARALNNRVFLMNEKGRINALDAVPLATASK